MTAVRPEGRYLDAGGVRTFVMERGEGEPMVLLHGSGPALDAHVTWCKVMPFLARRFRVVAPDLLGFGRTAMAADGRYRNRLERTAHAIALLDALGVSDATLVGHSEGGFVAARIAVERPDLARRLAIATSGGTAPALGGDADDAWREASAEAYDYAAATRDEESFLAASGMARGGDAAIEAMLRANYRLAEKTGTLAQFRDLPAAERRMRDYTRLQEERLFPHLDRIAAPVLLVWAADDATVPLARGEALMRMLPRADLHVFQRSGHMVMHDRAEDFARLVADWAAADRGQRRAGVPGR